MPTEAQINAEFDAELARQRKFYEECIMTYTELHRDRVRLRRAAYEEDVEKVERHRRFALSKLAAA